jgi:hypothetical protein
VSGYELYSPGLGYSPIEQCNQRTVFSQLGTFLCQLSYYKLLSMELGNFQYWAIQLKQKQKADVIILGKYSILTYSMVQDII